MLRWLLNKIGKRGARPSRQKSISFEAKQDATPNELLEAALEVMPPPPSPRYTADELHGFVKETEEPAIGMARIYPPDPTRPSRSFMGGLPKLPDDVNWPISTETNKAYTFLGQIDCRELPRSITSRWLPKTGTLWFFRQQDNHPYFQEIVRNTDEDHVVYRDVDATGLSERQPPDGPPWWEGTWGQTADREGFGPQRLSNLVGSYGSVLAKWPLEFAQLRTYRNDWNNSVTVWEDGETERPDLSAPSDLPRLKRIKFRSGEWEFLVKAYARLQREAWVAALGATKAEDRSWDASRPWHRRADTPITWLALRHLCTNLTSTFKRALANRKSAVSMENSAQRALAFTAFWLEEADSHPPLAIMRSDRKHEFLKGIQSLSLPDDLAGPLRNTSLAYALTEAIRYALQKQIWHWESGPAGFDPEFVEAETWKHRPFTRTLHFEPGNFDGPPKHIVYNTIFHRLLGATTAVYDGDPAPEGHVLLAQFCDDTGIDLYPGDLTFWIKPADLEAKDFTKVLITVGQEAINYNLDDFKPDER